MATRIRDGAVTALVASTTVEGNVLRAFVSAATYRGAPISVGDGIFIYVNPPATDDLTIQRMIGETVRHLAGA